MYSVGTWHEFLIYGSNLKYMKGVFKKVMLVQLEVLIYCKILQFYSGLIILQPCAA